MVAPLCILFSFYVRAEDNKVKLVETNPTFSFGLDLRADLSLKKTEVQTTGGSFADANTETFLWGSRRINFTGAIDNNTKYRVRLDANNSWGGGSTDTISDAIQFLYIDHMFDPNWSVRVGKQFLVSSGWELTHDASKIYHYGHTFLSLPLFFASGATLAYSINGNIIGAQATDSAPEGSANQNSDTLAKSLFWYGSFRRGRILPIASIASIPLLNYSNETVNQYALGVRFIYGSFKYDITVGHVDLPMNSAYRTTMTTSPTARDRKLYTMLANFHYRKANSKWQPFSKISWDRGELDGDDRENFVRVSLGTEYYPSSNKIWLHATAIHFLDEFKATSAEPGAKENITELRVGLGTNFY